MHAILDDPTDDTKGFLDPNTNENLTYLELIKRCVIDPETKLMLLPLVREEERNMYKTRCLFRMNQRQTCFQCNNNEKVCKISQKLCHICTGFNMNGYGCFLHEFVKHTKQMFVEQFCQILSISYLSSSCMFHRNLSCTMLP